MDVSRKQAMEKKDVERQALGEVERLGDTIRSALQDLVDANSRRISSLIALLCKLSLLHISMRLSLFLSNFLCCAPFCTLYSKP